MKLPQLFKTALLALASAAIHLSSFANTDGVALIPKISTAPVMDGEIDAIYHASGAFSINTLQDGVVESTADFSANWYGVYDAQRFYFIVDITDQFLNATSGGANWQQDIVEVYFNMDNAKPGGGNGHSGDNFQYHFGWNVPNGGVVSSNGSFANVQWIQITTSKGWRMEGSIPWASLGIAAPSEGRVIGFDIAVNDNDGKVAYDSVMYWYNSASALYGNIDGAGEILMGGDFDGNYRPEMADVDVQMATEGVASIIELTASDANASDTLTFSVTGLPSFANLVDNGNGTASININATAGDANIYYFEVSVSDGSNTDSMAITLIVKDPNVASQVPTFEAVATVNVNEGTLDRVQIVVTDLDSLHVMISAATTLPSFIRLVDNGDKTATLEVNPAFGATGSYTAELLATDEDNNTDTLTVSINVTSGVVRTEYYCDPVSGSMSNEGSLESPWASLQAVFTAQKLFKAGDTIHLLSGYHGEPSINAENTDYVYIKPASGASPRLSKISFGGNSAYWNLSGVTVSRSFASVYSIDTMVSLGGKYIVVDDCDIYSVDDISSWGISDWLAYGATGVNINGTYCLLKDSTVRNIRWGVFMNGDYSVMSGCRILHFSGDGARPLGNYTVIEDTLIADSYKVDDNHDDAIQSYTDGPGGIGSGVIKGVILRRNTIIETTDLNRPLQGALQGIGLFGGFYDDWIVENNVVLVSAFHGIAFYGARNCKIINNTVINQFGNSRVWIRIEANGAFGGGSGNLIANNLTREIYSTSASYATIRNNSVINASDYEAYFVDYPNDLRLKAGSPAINAGFNADAPIDDLTGAIRLSGSNVIVDTGAYEAAVSTWYGWPLTNGIYVDTGGYLGWLAVANDPWIYNYSINGWIYFHSFTQPSGSGCWGYFKR